jgi:putative copper export protein
MIDLDLVRIIIDFGLLILIWMVQLIIYPSFLYYPKEQLITWHKRYTPSIAVIVGPLMITQLGIAVYQLFNDQSLINTGYLILVVIVWVLTFLIFVPLHGKINDRSFDASVPKRLVLNNWYRTILWTLIFVVSSVVITVNNV